MKRLPVVLVSLLVSLTATATGLGDTLSHASLSEQEFLAILRNYHPLIRQANYSVDQADARLTAYRGAFDPLLTSQANRKRLAGDLYYNYYNSALVIPTWYGIEVYAGVEYVNGIRVNPENTPGSTSYLGISVPLLRDLLIDKRRATLRQAKLYLGQSKAERDLALNDFLYEALDTYWNWVKEYRLYTLVGRVVKVNEDRFQFVKSEYLLGNRPAIDTVEALAQLQQFQFLQQEAYLKFQNAGIDVSAFLWKENESPYILPARVIPDTLRQILMEDPAIPNLEELLSLAQREHPKLKSFSYKMDVLTIEQKLKWQGLMPRFDLKGNLLNKGYSVLSGVKGNFLANNYKFGFDFSMPLRFSEGRGAYREVKIKKAALGLDFDIQQQQIENKVKSYYNEVFSLRQQAAIVEKAQQNFQRLFDGELARFKYGESSLFQVNLRESKALEGMQKLVELKIKYLKSRIGLIWASGQLR